MHEAAISGNGDWVCGPFKWDKRRGLTMCAMEVVLAAANKTFTLVGGVNDLGIAMQQFPLGRLDLPKKFESAILKKEGFFVQGGLFFRG